MNEAKFCWSWSWVVMYWNKIKSKTYVGGHFMAIYFFYSYLHHSSISLSLSLSHSLDLKEQTTQRHSNTASNSYNQILFPTSTLFYTHTLLTNSPTLYYRHTHLFPLFLSLPISLSHSNTSTSTNSFSFSFLNTQSFLADLNVLGTLCAWNK